MIPAIDINLKGGILDVPLQIVERIWWDGAWHGAVTVALVLIVLYLVTERRG